MQKSLMWIHSDEPAHVEFRALHNKEIKYYPIWRRILQFGWIITSFSFVSSVFAHATSVDIPKYVVWILAAVLLLAAHAIMNVTYITALKRKFSQKSSFVYFLFPAFIMVMLLFADKMGSEALVSSMSYKAQLKDVKHDFYEQRENDARNKFETEKERIDADAKREIANATAWERREIKRFEALPQTAWTAKKKSELQAIIDNEASRITKKYDKKINSAIANRDTTLSIIFKERSNESTLIGRMNIAALDKEQNANQQANNTGWFASIFFLLSYIVITYRIEFCYKHGGISRDESTTPLDKYGGIFAYAYTIFKLYFTVKILDFIDNAAKMTGEDVIEIREIFAKFKVIGNQSNNNETVATGNKRVEIKGFLNNKTDSNQPKITDLSVITAITDKNETVVTETVAEDDIKALDILARIRTDLSNLRNKNGKSETVITRLNMRFESLANLSISQEVKERINKRLIEYKELKTELANE